MSNREIGFHLAALVALMLGAYGLYRYEMSPLIVPRLIHWLDDSDVSLAWQAAERLEALGPAAAPAAPTLVRLALDSPIEGTRAKAAHALPSVSLTGAVEVARRYQAELHADEVGERRRAAETLGGMGPVASAAVPDLAGAARDPDAIVRDRAVRALARIGTPTEIVLPALTSALDDSVAHVRYAALAAFAFDIPVSVARRAEAAIRERLDDEPMNVGLARIALDRLATEKADVMLRVAIDLLANAEPSVKTYQLRTLALMGPEAASAAPAVGRCLTNDLPLNRYLAAQTLGAMGPAAAGVTPALAAALHDDDPVVRAAATAALKSLETR